MDRLVVRLTPQEAPDLGRWTAVDLVVNGRDLKDLVTDFERAQNYEPAGGYDAISLAGLQHAMDRLTGEPNSWPGDGEVVLLVCEKLSRRRLLAALRARADASGPRHVVWYSPAASTRS